MKKRKVFTLILSVLFLIQICVPTCFAYATFNDHVLIGGVGNSGYNTRYYWLDSSTSSIATLIANAMYSWNHTAVTPGVTTPIWFQPVASQSYSVADFYLTSFPNSNVLAETKMYRNYYDHVTRANAYNEDWRWCEVDIYTQSVVQSTIAHEIGHVFGLAHVSSPNCIMYQGVRGRIATGPSADDCNGINHLY